MATGIDPTVDFAFRKLLGSPEHTAVTIHFLNSVLQIQPAIEQIEYVNPIIGPEFEDDKWSILDILARDAAGQLFNIEMQTSLPAALRERLVYYASSLFVGQLAEGDSYRDLAPAIGICVLSRALFPNCDQLHLDFRIRSAEEQILLTDHLQIHLIQLPKYTLPADNQLITDPIEQWAYFFRTAEQSSPAALAERLDDPIFNEAAEVLEMIAKSPRDRQLYEARLKMQRDEQARLDYAIEEGLAKGREQGYHEGREEGREEGLTIGEAKGKVSLLCDLLGLSIPPDLDRRSLEELQAIEADLRKQI